MTRRYSHCAWSHTQLIFNRARRATRIRKAQSRRRPTARGACVRDVNFSLLKAEQFSNDIFPFRICRSSTYVLCLAFVAMLSARASLGVKPKDGSRARPKTCSVRRPHLDGCTGYHTHAAQTLSASRGGCQRRGTGARRCLHFNRRFSRSTISRRAWRSSSGRSARLRVPSKASPLQKAAGA